LKIATSIILSFSLMLFFTAKVSSWPPDEDAAYLLDIHLNDEEQMLLPSFDEPALDPPLAERHVYSVAPFRINCPNYDQPYGCE